jgi:hypothetical protein
MSSQSRDAWYSDRIVGGNCCAVAEVCLDQISGSAEQKVETAIRDAIQTKRTLLFWHVLGKSPVYKDTEKVIICLPATQFIGEYKNKSTRRLIRSYVTNLQQEW